MCQQHAQVKQFIAQQIKTRVRKRKEISLGKMLTAFAVKTVTTVNNAAILALD